MKIIRILVFCIGISVMFNSAFSQGHHVRIGTIGNSITHGIALPKPLTQAFPYLLDDMLQGVYGDTCLVENFGLTTTTMLKNGDVSYWDTKHLKNYLSMMDTIRARNPSTRFILAYPPPAFEIKWGIRDSVIVNGVIPAIDSIKKVEEIVIMDFYYPLLDSAHLFPDNVHPGVEGNVVMAEMLMDRIIESDIVHKAVTGQTFSTIFFQAFQYDQFGLRFTGNYQDITWSLEGSGILYEETDTSIFFVCERPDTSYLEVSYQGNVSESATIITKPYPTGILKNESPGEFNIYPNPAHDKINIEMGPQEGGGIIQLKISDLTSGIYVMKIAYNGGVYTEQFIVD